MCVCALFIDFDRCNCIIILQAVHRATALVFLLANEICSNGILHLILIYLLQELGY